MTIDIMKCFAIVLLKFNIYGIWDFVSDGRLLKFSLGVATVNNVA